jgi:hypothetical protein
LLTCWPRRLLRFNRYKSSYSAYFTSFNEFLSFGWSAIVVTDKRTGKGHVTVKGGSGTTSSGATTNGYSSGGAVGQFARMIKTRLVGSCLAERTALLRR